MERQQLCSAATDPQKKETRKQTMEKTFPITGRKRLIRSRNGSLAETQITFEERVIRIKFSNIVFE